jgi:uncharacterized protein with HEPN domain
MNEIDLTRLKHMLDAAHEVVVFTNGEKRESLDNDIKLMRALSMSIGIIGEAASHVSDEVREASPQIPWRQIIGMRNFIIHAYSSIDLDILWNTATQAIPVLIVELEQLLSSENDN